MTSRPTRGTSVGGRVRSSGRLRLGEGESLANRYSLVKRLGKGGMGEVWMARHMLLEGHRAIKVIKASISSDPAFRERFLAEGQTMMSVKHPGVVEVTDLDELRSGELFMVMEHLEGRTLYDAIRDGDDPASGRLRDTVRIYKEIADGMQRIHDERIVHKDLKSDNVLLVPGDDELEHPKVIDFGLAKRVGDKEERDVEEGAAGVSGSYDPDLRTTLSGTLAYMAPEQFRAEPSSYQSDIYAFGVMLYEAFTNGKYPLPRGGLAHYIQLHKDGVLPARLTADAPELDPEIAAIADRCMAPLRTDRPESFAEVAEQLQWWLDAPERRKRRNRLIATATAFGLMAAIAVAGFLIGKTEPTLGGVTVASGGNELTPSQRDNRIHLKADRLTAMTFTAPLNGKADEPELLVDGVRVPAEIEQGGDEQNPVLVATADLSALEDGEHVVAFAPRKEGKRSEVKFHVDRVPTQITSVRLIGVDETRDDVYYTNAQAPVVVVDLESEDVASVSAIVGATRINAAPVDDESLLKWSVPGTSSEDGPVQVDLRVSDLAGNSFTRTFDYVRDTVPAEVSVLGLQGTDGVTLQLRDQLVEELKVHTNEPGEFSVEVGGAPPEVREVVDIGGARLTFPLTAVAETERTGIVVTFTDRAGNVTTKDVYAERIEDTATLTALDGSRTIAATGAEDLKLNLNRTYPIPAAFGVSARAVLDDGFGPPRPFTGKGWTPSDDRNGQIVIANSQLAALGEGVFDVAPTGLEPAQVFPLRLVLDRSSPEIVAVRVANQGGSVIPEGKWAKTKTVRITVIAQDLSMRNVEINGEGVRPLFDHVPSEGGQFDFEATLAREGANEFIALLTDFAGNRAEHSFVVNADWKAPTLLLASPTTGTEYDDRTAVEIAGETSETNCEIVFEDANASTTIARTGTGLSFTAGRRFDTPGTVTFTITAVDRAGWRSSPQTVSIDITRLKIELPDFFDWSKGVQSRMLKVEDGSVFIARPPRALTDLVKRVYIDSTEVTNAQYRAFLAAVNGRTGPWTHPDQPAGWNHVPPASTWNDPAWNGDDQPVVNVAFWDAWAFAAWSGRRLPTEAEWIQAAAKHPESGTLRRWPTGSETSHAKMLVISETGARGTRPSTAGDDVSPIGCLHMGGNVSEWTAPSETVTAEAGMAVVRGGNWYFGRGAASVNDHSANAKSYDRSKRAKTIGFRCAWDAVEEMLQ